MKVLVVEDNNEKKLQILALLKKYGLDDFCIDDNTRDGFYTGTDYNFDLLICDMDLPKNASFPIIDCDTEGLNLIKGFLERRILMPTIIFSPVEVEKKELDRIKSSGYPLLGHAKTASELDEIIDIKFFACDEDETVHLTEEDNNNIYTLLLSKYRD